MPNSIAVVMPDVAIWTASNFRRRLSLLRKMPRSTLSSRTVQREVRSARNRYRSGLTPSPLALSALHPGACFCFIAELDTANLDHVSDPSPTRALATVELSVLEARSV